MKRKVQETIERIKDEVSSKNQKTSIKTIPEPSFEDYLKKETKKGIRIHKVIDIRFTTESDPEYFVTWNQNIYPIAPWYYEKGRKIDNELHKGLMQYAGDDETIRTVRELTANYKIVAKIDPFRDQVAASEIVHSKYFRITWKDSWIGRKDVCSKDLPLLTAFLTKKTKAMFDFAPLPINRPR